MFGSKLLKWAGGAAKNTAGWYSGLGATAQHAIFGAGVGATTGAFGLNPINTIPFIGDIDAGGAFGGALAGAAAGAAFGRFGFRKNNNFAARGVNKLMGARRFNPSLINNPTFMKFAAGADRVSTFTNKHGNKILAGMAAGTAGLIGGSILSTNSPY